VGFLRAWFRGWSAPPATGSDAIAELARGLEGLPPERARFIAGFAFLLNRIATADHELTADEARTLERLVHEKAGLPLDQAAAVVERARTHQRRSGGTEDFLVTRELAQSASYDEKLAVIECLFAVAAADAEILTLESNEIGRIAKELRVEQSDLSRIRQQYRDFLAARTGLSKDSA
jgi:uncharacterized tellurite resistance protein B-like protein